MNLLTRNYQTNNTDIVIAIVSIPVVDIDTVIGVGIANISDIGTNVLLYISPLTKFTAV